MYAQIRKYNSIRGGHTVAEVCRDIEQTGVARFDKIPGFVDYFVLELNDGGLLTFNLYENQAGVEAAKKVSAEWNKTKAASALPEKPDQAFEGEIRIHHPVKAKKAA
jgi:hypothetical protein